MLTKQRYSRGTAAVALPQQHRKRAALQLLQLTGFYPGSVYDSQRTATYDILCTRLCLPGTGFPQFLPYWFIRGKLADALKQLPAYCQASLVMSWRLW